MTKLLALMSAICVFGFAATANAQESDLSAAIPGELTANVALTTDYVYRGISQSDEGAAIQGGVDYTYDANDNLPGFYAGVWASTVDFADANVEIDAFAGISGSVDQIGDWKLGAIYYAYPGADDSFDFWELATSVTHDFGIVAATASYNYSPDFFDETGNGHYPALGVTVPLPYDLTLNGHVGYQSIEDAESYWDWSAGIGYTWTTFGVSLNYIDTDLDEPSECADGCSERVVLTVSKTF